MKSILFFPKISYIFFFFIIFLDFFLNDQITFYLIKKRV